MVEGHKSVMDDEEFQEQMSNKILDKMIDGKNNTDIYIKRGAFGRSPLITCNKSTPNPS